MYRRGIVTEVDPDTHRVRVRFDERQGMVSGWLDVLARDTLDDKDFGLPSEGAMVACMMDERDEDGCVLGSIYSTTDRPAASSVDKRSITFKDGVTVEYDRAAHKLKVKGDGLVLVEVGDAGAQYVALANLVDARLAQMQAAFDAHFHPTGVGPSGTTVPIGALDSVACEKLKTA